MHFLAKIKLIINGINMKKVMNSLHTFFTGKHYFRSSVREFLCSEAMHYLGVPTSRAATLTVTDDPIPRKLDILELLRNILLLDKRIYSVSIFTNMI